MHLRKEERVRYLDYNIASQTYIYKNKYMVNNIVYRIYIYIYQKMHVIKKYPRHLSTKRYMLKHLVNVTYVCLTCMYNITVINPWPKTL